MTSSEQILERWRANARAAGIELPDAVVERAISGGSIEQVIAYEALLRRLRPDFTMPDELNHPLDEEPADA